MSTQSTTAADQPDDAPVAEARDQPARGMLAVTDTPGGEMEENGEKPAARHVPAQLSQEGGSLERMAQLRRLVRQDGLDPAAAADALGVDPIIAQLWLRLPDDLWPAGHASTNRLMATTPAGAEGTSVAPGVPLGGLRRVLTCRVPAPAIDRLRASGGTIGEGAAAALEAGLAQPRPPVAPGGWRFPRRPLAVPIAGETYKAVLQLAQDAFRGDPRDAAGWLIARGTGVALPLPTEEELAGALRLSTVPPVAAAPASPVRFVVPPRRRPETRAPLPADDSAPSGEELRRRRDAAGLSQRDLAAASGLSRGLVAEIERGRRRHVLTRLKLAETLAAVERSKPSEATS